MLVCRVGRGRQKLVFTTGFNWFKPAGRNPLWQKLAKAQMTKTIAFLPSNCLKCTNVCLDVIGTYFPLCLIGFLVGDYSKGQGLHHEFDIGGDGIGALGGTASP